MIHYEIGFVGHGFVVSSFVCTVFSFLIFFFCSSSSNKQSLESWGSLGIIFYYGHVVSVIGVVITLLTININHYFEYHYAWSHTSRYLPLQYQISSFWNGQEGSFLLWMFWNAILGLVLLHTNKSWKAPVMTVMSMTQVFLSSMILGVVFFGFKLGSSPFLLLRDVFNDSIFKINPNYIPSDGNGLNPLLQNYWMVIHPPTLFLGFASTVIPFAYCIAGMATGRYVDWIKPALPWAQFAALTLGIGILMGAYWAYETLNFGGYWSWDPVENAIYVPWLTLVASIHTMIAYKKRGTALKFAIIMVIVTFILILYSTFLTRSGILGESSVHSFTDLGLQGQLLIYLFVYLCLSIFLCGRIWKKLPTSKDEVSVYSREFWIFMGAAVLCLMAFHVIFFTSIPVFNEILQLFGFDGNIAPFTDPVSEYTGVQLWLSVALALLSGTGQFFWWKRIKSKILFDELKTPLVLSLIVTTAIVMITKVTTPSFLVLMTCSFYSIMANGKILLKLKSQKIQLAGGSITHIGIAMMLIGIIFSSGHSKIVSKNNTGLVWSKDFPDEFNRDNLLLFINEPRRMTENYTLTYKGIRKLTKESGFIKASYLKSTGHPLKFVLAADFMKSKKGDTVNLYNNENSYFEIDYSTPKKSFTLFPRIQNNEKMGRVSSPDIKRALKADLYTHVKFYPDDPTQKTWSEPKLIDIKLGETFFINDYAGRFLKIQPIDKVDGVLLEGNDVAIKAVLEIEGEYETYRAEPIYIIKDNMAGKIPYTIDDIASKIHIESINPAENTFTFALSTTQKDWIILEAVEKPFINVLWAGTFFMVLGFVVAIYRRYKEFIIVKNKEIA